MKMGELDDLLSMIFWFDESPQNPGGYYQSFLIDSTSPQATQRSKWNFVGLSVFAYQYKAVSSFQIPATGAGLERLSFMVFHMVFYQYCHGREGTPIYSALRSACCSG